MSVLRRGRWVYAVLDPVPTEVELLASIREAEGSPPSLVLMTRNYWA